MGGVGFDEVAQVAEALLHTGGHGDDGAGVGGRDGDAGGGYIAAVTDDVFPRGALLGMVVGDVLAAADLIEIIRIVRLGIDLICGQTEQHFVVVDVVFEGEKLSGEVSLLIFDQDGVRKVSPSESR